MSMQNSVFLYYYLFVVLFNFITTVSLLLPTPVCIRVIILQRENVQLHLDCEKFQNAVCVWGRNIISVVSNNLL